MSGYDRHQDYVGIQSKRVKLAITRRSTSAESAELRARLTESGNASVKYTRASRGAPLDDKCITVMIRSSSIGGEHSIRNPVGAI